MLFDIDREGGALAWEDNRLPMPAWATINRENRHAHLAYALAAPVLTADFGGRQAALRYLAAIEAAYRAKLGGDDGFASLITKNPVHPHWELLQGVPEAVRGYDLPYLADFIDLQRFKPYVGRTNPEAVGLGRNCTVFNVVSRWAYKSVLQFKHDGYTRTGWQKKLITSASKSMATFLPPCCPTRLNASPNQLGDGFGHTSPLKTKLHGMQHKITAVKPQQTQAEKAQAQSF